MLRAGVLGINYKTADLSIREAVARGVIPLSGERGVFFPYPIVLLSTCNRTEIYFSGEDLALAHSDLLAYLRVRIGGAFEHRFYSYFGVDCFFHLCRVAAGLDSAVLAETEIQRQVKGAYGQGRHLPSSLHFIFQKALKIGKEVRNRWVLEKRGMSLYGALWHLANWKDRKILLVGYSEINRGLISFLSHKGIENISLCTRVPSEVEIKQVKLCDRTVLEKWEEYDVIVCATKGDGYLIGGGRAPGTVIFDLSVPRNVDPRVEALLYNIEQLNQWIGEKGGVESLRACEDWIWEHVLRLARIYRMKTSLYRQKNPYGLFQRIDQETTEMV